MLRVLLLILTGNGEGRRLVSHQPEGDGEFDYWNQQKRQDGIEDPALAAFLVPAGDQYANEDAEVHYAGHVHLVTAIATEAGEYDGLQEGTKKQSEQGRRAVPLGQLVLCLNWQYAILTRQQRAGKG